MFRLLDQIVLDEVIFALRLPWERDELPSPGAMVAAACCAALRDVNWIDGETPKQPEWEGFPCLWQASRRWYSQCGSDWLRVWVLLRRSCLYRSFLTKKRRGVQKTSKNHQVFSNLLLLPTRTLGQRAKPLQFFGCSLRYQLLVQLREFSRASGRPARKELSWAFCRWVVSTSSH